MKTTSALGVALAAACLAFAGVARGQSLNVDFGLAPDAPSATYAAAGLAGTWNSIPGTTGTTYHLVGLDGRPTGVTLSQIGGTELRSATDPALTGDDARLMNDALITYDPGLEVCLFVNGLTPGTYEVTMYAWMPNEPAVLSRVRHDLSTVTVNVGGAWPGSQVEGVTYARHTLVIGSAAFLRSHSGIVPGAVAANGAALNGFQLRLLDSSGDAGVDAGRDAGRDAGARDAGMHAMDVETPPTPDASTDAADDAPLEAAADVTPGDDASPTADASAHDAQRDAATPPSHDGATADAGDHDAAHGCACGVGATRHRSSARDALGLVLVGLGLAIRARSRRRARG